MPFEPEEQKEIGRIKKENCPEIVVRVSKYKGEEWVDMRKYLTTDKFTGWSKQGLALRKKDLPELVALLKKIK
jgi:hypothetical protein